MDFERQNSFQKALTYIFFQKNDNKYVFLLYLKFSDLLPKTHLLFYLAMPWLKQSLLAEIHNNLEILPMTH